MLPFTKLALVTCAFYVGINLLLDVAIFGLATRIGLAGIHLTHGSRCVFFGVVWAASFSLAWRIVMTALFANIPK